MDKIFHNFNETCLPIAQLPCGKYHRRLIKVGRKLYYMDIDKNVQSAFIEVYDYSEQSKYESKYHPSIWVKSNAYIDRDFIQNIEAIENAERLVEKYHNELTIFSYC